MTKEKIGNVTLQEKEELVQILERKLALKELMVAMDSQPYTEEVKKELYNRIEDDLEKIKAEYGKWLSYTSQKYEWKLVKGKQLKIDFNTSEVFVIESSNELINF